MADTVHKDTMNEVGLDSYATASGFTMAREQNTLTPNGNPVSGRWVLRSPDGSYIDCDQYQHDLIERHGFRAAY
jgi:hypothetical protein